MRMNPREPTLELLTALAAAAAIWAASLTALAAGPAESTARQEAPVAVMTYEVAEGDSLGSIAAAHGVTIEELIATNEIEDPDRIYAGAKLRIPGDPKNGRLTKRGVVLEIPRGFTLSRIAEIYETSVGRLTRANRLDDPDRLREGQRLLVPGAKRVRELVPPPPCFKDPVTVYRVRTDETRVVPLCFCSGKPNPEAVRVVSELSGPVNREMPFPLHARLIQLLQKVAERYPGKRIEIVSGQRTRAPAGSESFHTKGRAIDFRVEGVGNRELAWFVRTFDRVGVGYYPNSVFIHLDTRKRNAWWIDYSRPGEKAIYARAGLTDAQLAEIREARAARRK